MRNPHSARLLSPMSYCFNPRCQQPQNPPEANICRTCGSYLLLGDRYRALHPIGQGGFGRTFLAMDQFQPNGVYYVIKQFLPQMGMSAKAAELFRLEAQQLHELGQHPQIPELIAHFEFQDQQYLVQEFIDGLNLEQVLANQGPFSEGQILQVLQEMLPVLQFIHSRQVIHRDIKPENIIQRRGSASNGHASSQRPSLVLVDFGASKAMTETAIHRTGTRIGSAGYAAPEQTVGRASFSSDLYSLGITCIHLLTQRMPMDLYSEREGAWVWREYLPPNHALRPHLGYVLDGMLELATRDRYQSADEVLRDLTQSSTVQLKYRKDHEPVKPEPINLNCRLERATLTGFTVAALLTTQMMPIATAMLSIGVGASLVLYFLNYRFRSVVSVSEKFRLRQDTHMLRQEIRDIEQHLRQLMEEQTKLKKQAERRIRETSAQHKKYDQAENDEIARIDREFQQHLAAIRARQQKLSNGEEVEIAKALRRLQNAYRKEQLTSQTVEDARIPGIGKALTRALQAEGIYTAADIDIEHPELELERIQMVAGVGEAKANSLLNWREDIEVWIESTLPSVLPPDQEERVRQRHQAKIQHLVEEEARIRQALYEARETTLQTYQRHRDAIERFLAENRVRTETTLAELARQIDEHQRRLTRKREALNRAKRQLEAYRQISFAAYLRQIVLPQTAA